MVNRTGIDVSSALSAALADIDLAAPSANDMSLVVLAAYLDRLAEDHGLSEHHEEALLERTRVPQNFVTFLNHYLKLDIATVDSDQLRDRLYRLFAAEVADASPPDRHRTLGVAQVYWNLSWEESDRDQLPLKNGPLVDAIDRHGRPTKLASLIWAGWVESEQQDLGRLPRSTRTNIVRQGPIGTSGRKLREEASHLSVSAARRMIAASKGTAPNLSKVTMVTIHRRGRSTLAVTETEDGAAEASVAVDRPALARPRLHSKRQGTIESAGMEVAARVALPAGLSIVTERPSVFDPATFLSGASMNPAEVGRYAVPRRIDLDASILDTETFADRLREEPTVCFLAAGAGEGKSTFLHALSAALVTRTIVVRWSVTDPLDWQKIQDVRDSFRALTKVDGPGDLTVVVLGEIATTLSREHEDEVIRTVQSIPAGVAPPAISIVLAGRPAWLNRIRQRTSTGKDTRLMPLSELEVGSLIDRLAEAYGSCRRSKGMAWTEAHFPNLPRFLASPHASQVEAFGGGKSLVGALLHAAYGNAFVNRLTAEYSDLPEADRAAYLAVSLATSALGGMTEDLLEAICPDIDARSEGAPWQRSADGVHSARHEMIGKLVVEDSLASTARQVSAMIAKVVAVGRESQEARDLFLSSVRIFDEPQSLVPPHRRKTEPQFRRAVRNGVLVDRDAWERLESSIGSRAGDLLACSYILHRLLPEKLSDTESNAYLLERSAHLLARAESTAGDGSALADRARYHRIFVERAALKLRQEPTNDITNVRTLLPMLEQAWPESVFYAQFVSLGISSLRNSDLDADEQDEIAGGVLQAWQRLRIDGAVGEQRFAYSGFVARDLFDWPEGRRLGLWLGAWEFSCSLGNPDGSLACLIDGELGKRRAGRLSDETPEVRVRRMRVLSDSVVPGQTNSEVVLRYARLAGAEDGLSRHRISRVGSQLEYAADPVTRSMALHSLAIVSPSADDQLRYLRAALTDYGASINSRDDWLTRGGFWREALRMLRALDSVEAETLEKSMSASARKFRA